MLSIKEMQEKINAGKHYKEGEVLELQGLFPQIPEPIRAVAGVVLASCDGQSFEVEWAGLRLPTLLLVPNEKPTTVEVVAKHVAGIRPSRVDVTHPTDYYFFTDILNQPMLMTDEGGTHQGTVQSEDVVLKAYPFIKPMRYAVVQVEKEGVLVNMGILSLRGTGCLGVIHTAGSILAFAFNRNNSGDYKKIIEAVMSPLSFQSILGTTTKSWSFDRKSKKWKPSKIGDKL